MNKNKAKKFYEQADEYCRFITENVITPDKVPNLMKLLMTLYVSAVNLPDTEPETTDSSSDISETVSFRIGDQIRFLRRTGRYLIRMYMKILYVEI